MGFHDVFNKLIKSFPDGFACQISVAGGPLSFKAFTTNDSIINLGLIILVGSRHVLETMVQVSDKGLSRNLGFAVKLINLRELSFDSNLQLAKVIRMCFGNSLELEKVVFLAYNLGYKLVGC